MPEDKATGRSSAERGSLSPPTISLPKGGGAIHGIGEKFAANPVTGTGSMTVPIATSPGRSGFGPAVSLSYDSGAGNGPFGFGWSLSLPSVTRKTDKGLPRYNDADESDVFILSGAEDLVPVPTPTDVPDPAGFKIQRYRPRIEGLFARIERWTKETTGEIHWRSISRDNITTIYGETDDSRILNPADLGSSHPPRIFSWLICQSYDDKGNTIVYQYVPEDSRQVDASQANERNRTPTTRKANRYLKRIKYGNTVSRLLPDFSNTKWLFEVVFDYGEGHLDLEALDTEGRQTVRAQVEGTGSWPVRPDPFSAYRSSFEVRTYRLCERVLMFHHFPDELGVEDYLVRGTEFEYERGSIASFLTGVTQSGYVAWPDPANPTDLFLQRSLPPIEFEYSKAVLSDEVREVDPESLENLPAGMDGGRYQWVDLDGEGVSGILTEQADSWFYKRNLGQGRLGPVELVARTPSLANVAGGGQQFLDLSGDGQLDLAQFAGEAPGFHERTTDEAWEPLTPFRSLPRIDWENPHLRFADLTGDGHADVLITEDSGFVWHPSLGEDGFGPGEQATQPLDEERGPRLMLADGSQSIYLADLSGDGLSDLVRIRNGEVSYWPNLGYGRFGPRVTMDNSPCFDHPDLFDQQQIRLADIDGSGTTDLIYLKRGQATIYRNLCGNGWGKPEVLASFPPIDDLSTVLATDLLGTGTACLVWSSPLPGDTRRPMRYIDLMAEGKPHLLITIRNNLGAETRMQYASSTKFYLADRVAGRPWITKLPFPVHVVERVETWDWISRNRFVSTYTYHHGYFDGVEREFRGFGLVEQRDTEAFAALSTTDAFPPSENIDAASHVPPVLTKTWFHTGVYLGPDRVSNFFGGLLNGRDRGEYYREPAWLDDYIEAAKRLLEDTVLPPGLTVDEEREACRALKGTMLRQEVYALDGTSTEDYRHGHPYTVTEQNFSIAVLQRRGENRHGVYFTHAGEAINYHYERDSTDPRTSHAITLEVDLFGNVLKSASIGYGRRKPDPDLEQDDQTRQTQVLVTYTENKYTKLVDTAEDYHAPLPCESCTYELTNYPATGNGGRFHLGDFVQPYPNPTNLPLTHIFDDEIGYEETSTAGKQRRLIEQVRTYYRPDDLGLSQNNPLALLPLGTVGSRALPGETYKLAMTAALAKQVFVDSGKVTQADFDTVLADEGKYVHSEGDADWWIPSGRVFCSSGTNDTATVELAEARQHFFVPRRYRDPFHTTTLRTESFVDYDDHDLLIQETRDALGNSSTAGERTAAGTLTVQGNDYRVLQPRLMMDPNRNRTAAAFDALGLVAGTAVMGKPFPATAEGDSLDGFEAELTEGVIQDQLGDPLADPGAVLGGASTRLVYDLFAYHRTRGQANPQPAVVHTLVRETHDSDPVPVGGLRIQASFSYSDGFGREIQKKVQAEPGPLVAGGPNVSSRWVGSGWTIFNNKGKPVRRYEPFFSQLPAQRHRFQFGVQVGMSPILFYDPLERVIATLHPNRTWEKVVFDPWRQATWDVNDTVTIDPRNDEDVKGFFLNPNGTSRLPTADYLPAWHALRTSSDHAAEATLRWPDQDLRDAEKRAAEKAAAHEKTPAIAYSDSLGRTFLTLAHNGFRSDGTPIQYPTRVHLDIEGNQREVRDAIEQNGDTQGRVVMRYRYDMLGTGIHQVSMDAGERWMLNDVAGKPIRAWDSVSHTFRTEYDSLRRPLRSFVTGADPDTPNQEFLTERLVYGEQHPQDEQRNLRGKLYLHLDQVGVVSTEAHDFKGNPLRGSRRLALQYDQPVDWRAVDDNHAALPPNPTTKLTAALEAALSPWLETETFTSRTAYDALNRPVQIIAPHSDQPGAKLNVIQPAYNDASLLERVDVWLDYPSVPTGLLDAVLAPPSPVGVSNIDYDAKGQRLRIAYKNGAATRYVYDRETFRLIHLYTRRGAGFGQDCGATPPPPRFAAPQTPPQGTPCGLQNLHYTYDPAGNLTRIHDDAQQIIYFNGQVVPPHCEYIYDPMYRLIGAAGREHIGQVSQPETTWNDEFRVKLPHPGDGTAMRNYTETYEYDAVGNFKKLMHHATPNGNWNRAYSYNEDSLTEPATLSQPAKKSNRLSSTTVGTGPAESYAYDAHGNITSMPHLPLMQWDYRDQLQASARQVVTNGTPETTWYAYDAGGQRVRKVTESQASAGQTPKRMNERIYLGALEIYREYETDGTTIKLARDTLHIMDDQQRIALVETRTDGAATEQLIRYQFGNHLGSASLELDHQAQVITYEEYYPYGSTAYQAVRSQTETPKRYRYTGQERDEETGLCYHSARYYAPWLARWTSCDPAGVTDGTNSYQYSRQSPITGIDTTGLQTTTQTNVPTNPFVASGRYGWLHSLPGFTKEHMIPGSWLEYALQAKYGETATRTVAPRLYRNAWTSLLSNTFAGPKTSLDLSFAAQLRGQLQTGGGVQVTDFYLRAMQHLKAGGSLSPGALELAHQTALQEMVSYVKGEKFVQQAAQGKAVQTKLDVALKPGGNTSDPGAKVGKVEVTTFAKKTVPAGKAGTAVVETATKPTATESVSTKASVDYSRPGRAAAAGGALMILMWVMPDDMRTKFEESNLSFFSGVYDFVAQFHQPKGDPTQEFIQKVLNSNTMPSEHYQQLMERHGYRYEGMVGGKPKWTNEPVYRSVTFTVKVR